MNRSQFSPGADANSDQSRLLLPVLGNFYRIAEPASYALLRLAFGIILVTHGLPKILGEGHGGMADPTASAVNFIQNRLYLPAPAMFGAFVTGLESVGGILLALGLATRLVAPMVGVEMAAICFILGPTWVWLERGIEYPLLMGFLALFISLRGGGRYSLDHLIGKEI